jgi:hypothetical protein
MATAVVTPYVGTQGTLGKSASEVGEAQKLFAEQAETRVQELLLSGQCEPFTIINFNPFPVGLQGVLKQYKVWSPDDQALPPDVLRMELEWEGKRRRGHVLTVRYPKKDGKMVGASASSEGVGVPIAQREPKLYLPKEIAFSFMEHYSPVFTARAGTVLPPAPKDARKTYGLLVFQGDVDVLENLLQETDPEKRMIQVPICHIQTVGKTSIKSFRTIPFNLDDYLEQMFTGQKKYWDAVITRAQQKWNGTDDDRKNISDFDRIIYRAAIELGYAKKPAPGEKTWLNEYLTLVEDAGTAGLRKCQACKTLEPEPDTPFCPKCNAPIDTFATFMAGFPVPDAWLHTIKDPEQRAEVQAELKRRAQGFEAEPAKRGPYKRGKSVDPAEEVPAAESTALPGEE